MIRSLLWKEWHEQWWRIAFGCVMLGAFTALGLKVRIIPDVGVIVLGMLFGAFVMPLLMAMGLIAPEHADRTLPTLISMPLAPRKTLTIKLLVGVLGCLLPLATAEMITLLMAGGREMTISKTSVLFAGGGIFAGIFLLWIIAFSVAQPTEAHVGLVGIALPAVFAGAVWAGHFVGSPNPLVQSVGTGTLIFWAINPLTVIGFTFDKVHGDPSGRLLLFGQSVAVILVFGIAIYRFQRLGRARS